MAITQGTNPTISMTIYQSDGETLMPLDDVDLVEVVITQMGTSAEIAHCYEPTIDAENSVVSYTLTEAETMAIKPDRRIYVQARLRFNEYTDRGEKLIVATKKQSVLPEELLSNVLIGGE